MYKRKERSTYDRIHRRIEGSREGRKDLQRTGFTGGQKEVQKEIEKYIRTQ